MLFINTRPKDRASALSQVLAQSSFVQSILELPLLELHPVTWSMDLAMQMQQLRDADVIVVVSPTAVELGMQALQKADIALNTLKPTLQWIAVGEATAVCLKRYGIMSHVPQVETSEGMLNLPILNDLATSSTVGFWRGVGGREFMMNHLQESGRQVINCVLYQRQCPHETIDYLKSHKNLINLRQKYSILISSEASWLNWLLYLDSQHQMNMGCYLVLGERLESVLKQYREQHQLDFQIIRLSDLQPLTIEKALARLQGSS